MDKKKIVSTIAGVAALGMAGVAGATTGEVNVREVLKDVPEFQEATKTLGETAKEISGNLNEAAKGKSQEEQQKLVGEANQQLNRKEKEVMGPIETRFKSAVEKAAKDQGVDTVISSGALLYGKADVDLTEAVKANMKN